MPPSLQTYVGSVQLSGTLAGIDPSIHPVSVDVPPAWAPLQLSSIGTFHPFGLRLRNAKLPPSSRSLSYQNEQVCPIVGDPLGGAGQFTERRLLTTIGTGLLL